MKRSARIARIVWIGLVLALMLGCSSTFARLVSQGDRLAAQGRWDEAASYYERAVQIEPDDEEARAKLLQARRAQTGQRIARARKLLEEGKASEALRPLFEATRLDPGHAEARQLYDKTKADVFAEADARLARGDGRGALALAVAVLAVEPEDARARRIDQAARQAVADQSVAAGQAFQAQGHVAAAVVEYAEALVYLETHAQAASLFASARAALLERTVYHVRAATFVGDEKADELGSTVSAADLASGLPDDLLLRVEDTDPPAKDFLYAGMRLGGVFRNYRHARSTKRAKSTCRYVCGKQTVDNPAYPQAQAEVAAAQSDLRRAQGNIRHARAGLPALQSNVTAARGRADEARMALAAAEATLTQCQSNFGSDCSVLQAQVDASTEQSQRAAEELSEAEDQLSDARSALEDAETARELADNRLRLAQAKAGSTPPTIVVDKHCNHDYVVETVTVRGEVEVLLRGEPLYETNALLNETVTGRYQTEDQTFPAVRGKCAELERGDPLELPSDSDVRRAVVQSAVRETQKQIVASYDKERSRLFERSKIDQQDGNREAAVDGALRFALMGRTLGRDEEDALRRVAGVLGVSEQAARKAASRDPGQGRARGW